MIQIELNGEAKEIDDNSTVASLVAELSLPNRGLAVEVNYEVIPRSKHPDVILKSGDHIEIVTLVGGG